MTVDDWLRALEARHLSDLRFPEVSRALRSLSAAYVEQRDRLPAGAALNGAGKRAAFALFYGPLHFLLIDAIVRALPAATRLGPRLVDLGCGTGAAGAAWACACDQPPEIIGIDRHPWALAEAAWTWQSFGLRHRTKRDDAMKTRLPPGAAVLAAFSLNEMEAAGRDRILETLVTRRSTGAHALIVEPLARGIAPWWGRWARRAIDAGGRADEWRFPLDRPAIIEKLDRATGLDHRELTGRSLFL